MLERSALLGLETISVLMDSVVCFGKTSVVVQGCWLGGVKQIS